MLRTVLSRPTRAVRLAAALLALWTIIPVQAEYLTPEKVQQLEQVTSRLLNAAIVQNRISAAGVVITEGGCIKMMNTFGYHDWATLSKVDPQTSQFEVGSITKLFTAIATEKLRIEGKIQSLDDSANSYLKQVQLPSRDGRDVKITDLLSHNSGFEDRIYGWYASKDRTPDSFSYRLISTPGELSLYSSYNYAVLGLLIEDITGEPYRKHMGQQYFEQIGMRHTDIWTDSADRTNLVEPKVRVKYAPYRPTSHLYSGGGGMITTVSDMAAFLGVALGGDSCGDTNPSTVPPADVLRSIHNAVFDEAGAGSLWWRGRSDQGDTLAQGGRISATASELILIPATKIGFFYAQQLNSQTGEVDLRRELLDIILGSSRQKQVSEAEIARTDPVEKYYGRYRSLQRAHGHAEEILELIRQRGTIFDISNEVLEKCKHTGIGEFDCESGPGGLSWRFISYRGQDMLQLSHAALVKVRYLSDPTFVRHLIFWSAMVFAMSWFVLLGAKARGPSLTALKAVLFAIAILGLSTGLVAYGVVGFRDPLISDIQKGESSRLALLLMFGNSILLLWIAAVWLLFTKLVVLRKENVPLFGVANCAILIALICGLLYLIGAGSFSLLGFSV